MSGEARLEQVASGLAPASDGWFVVNAADAAWVANEAFGNRCVFAADPRVLRDRPDPGAGGGRSSGRASSASPTALPAIEPRPFPQLGVTLAVVRPGTPSGLYHSESAQEDFLVLAGECLLLIEGGERRLRAWDFVHCPPGTAHCFVGAGEEPCVLLMVGARPEGKTLAYPREEVALRHGAGVETATPSPREAYAPFPHWRPGRPEGWDALPWVASRK